MIRVAVLAGGVSPEHDVSIRSGMQVIAHLDGSRFEVWPVRLDRDGQWLPAQRPVAQEPVEDGFWTASMQPMRPGAAVDWLLAHAAVDVVFPVLHGPHGEDGTVQGMLELHGLACVGSRCAASAIAMDKIMTRHVLRDLGIPIANGFVPTQPLARADADSVDAEIRAGVGYPCFLKVDHSGSTLGVAPARDRDDVARFLDQFRTMGRRFLVEARVAGEEITVPVLGNAGGPLEALPPVGIYPRRAGYFDHESKYADDGADEVVPPRGLDAGQNAEAQELARRCHEALQCDGMSRTDIIWGADGPVVLEVNTIPGLTEVSLMPRAARAHGLTFGQLLTRLIDLALEGRGGPFDAA